MSTSEVPDQVRFWNGSAKVEADEVRAWDGSQKVLGIFRRWGGSSYTLIHPTSLPAPTNLGAIENVADPYGSIDLSWDALPAGVVVETIRVERAPDTLGSPGTYAEIVSLAAAATSHTDTGLNDDSRYWYRIRYAIELEPLYGTYSNADDHTTQLTPVTQAPVLSAEDLASDDTSLSVSWTAVPEATSYILEVSLNGSTGWTQIYAGPGTSYTHDIGEIGGTRYYRSRGTNANTTTPTWSNVGSATTVARLPGAPASVTASADGDSVLISWTAGSPDNETGYRLESSTDGGTNYTPLTTVGADVLSYDHTAVSGGTTYTYRVRAENSAGDSAWTVSNSELFCATPDITINSFTNITDASVDVGYSWTGTVDTVKVRYRENGTADPFVEVTDGDTASPVTITGLSANTTYDIQILASNVCGGSTGWVIVSGAETFTTDHSVPGEITTFTLVDVVASDTDMFADWSGSVDAQDYELRVSLTAMSDPAVDGTAVVGTLTDTEEQFDAVALIGASHGSTIYAAVRGTNPGHNGPWKYTTGTLSARVPGAPATVVMSNPTGFTVRTTITPGTPDNATTYRFERQSRAAGGSTWPGTWTLTGTTTDPDYVDDFEGLEGNEYRSRVRAENAAGSSAWTISTDDDPGDFVCLSTAPTVAISSISNITDATLDVNYTLGSGTVDAVDVQYRIDGSASAWTQVTDGDLSSPVPITGLAENMTYEFQIRGRNNCGDTQTWTASTLATTEYSAPAGVTNLTVVPTTATDDKVDLDWDPATDASEYEVYVSLSDMAGDPIANGTKVTTNPTASDLAALDVSTLLGATGDDQIFAQVRGKNGDQFGTFSAQASGYTHRTTPGVSMSEDTTDCDTDGTFDIILSLTHTNTDGDTRSEAGTWDISSDGGTTWTAATGTFTAGAATITVADADTSYDRYRVKYDSEAVYTESGMFVAGCPI